MSTLKLAQWLMIIIFTITRLHISHNLNQWGQRQPLLTWFVDVHLLLGCHSLIADAALALGFLVLPLRTESPLDYGNQFSYETINHMIDCFGYTTHTKGFATTCHFGEQSFSALRSGAADENNEQCKGAWRLDELWKMLKLSSGERHACFYSSLGYFRYSSAVRLSPDRMLTALILVHGKKTDDFMSSLATSTFCGLHGRGKANVRALARDFAGRWGSKSLTQAASSSCHSNLNPATFQGWECQESNFSVG